MNASPFNRNMSQTEAAIKEILRHGTPDWVKHPEDYRNFANEEFYKEHENSCAQVAEYRIPDQELLTNQNICPDSARLVNFIHVRDFFTTLRENGVQCVMIWNRIAQQGALHAVVPGERLKGHQYITYVHLPYMPEWSTWRLDDHGLLNGESARGWRTVLYYLIQRKVLSEEKVSEIFGEPHGPASTLHRRALWKLRNPEGFSGRLYVS